MSRLGQDLKGFCFASGAVVGDRMSAAVYLLQASNDHRSLAAFGRDRLDERFGTCDRGHTRYIELESRLSDRLFVVEGRLAKWRVDNQRDLVLTDQIGDIRAALVYLEYGLAFKADLTKTVCRAKCCHEIKAKFVQPPGDDD